MSAVRDRGYKKAEIEQESSQKVLDLFMAPLRVSHFQIQSTQIQTASLQIQNL